MPETYCYEHPRPAVTVDVVLVHRQGDDVRVLLVERKHDPFAGRWAIPGGFLDIDEPVEAAARRELEEETGVRWTDPLPFLGVYGAPDRDPRGRTISLAHVALVRGAPPACRGGDDAAAAAWLDPGRVENLAFDHATILRDALAAVGCAPAG